MSKESFRILMLILIVLISFKIGILKGVFVGIIGYILCRNIVELNRKELIDDIKIDEENQDLEEFLIEEDNDTKIVKKIKSFKQFKECGKELEKDIVDNTNLQENFEDIKEDILYEMPKIDFLDDSVKYEENNRIEEMKILLKQYKIKAQCIDYIASPIFDIYVLELQIGESIKKIENLKQDIMLYFEVKNIEIDKFSFGSQKIGICMKKKIKQEIKIKEFIDSEEYKNFNTGIPIVIGKNNVNNNFIEDLDKIKSLLIFGTTGSGKTMFLYNIILSILYKFNPNEMNLILVDTQRNDFNYFKNIPHLLVPIIDDINKFISILTILKDECIKRYEIFKQKNVENINEYNNLVDKKMSRIVLIIDNYCDIAVVENYEINNLLNILFQFASNFGIYIIISTNVLTKEYLPTAIKNKISTRVSFKVSSSMDSRMIIDENGAEKLTEKGEIIYKRYDTLNLEQIYIPFVSDREIKKVVDFIKYEKEAKYNWYYKKADNEESIDVDDEEREDPLLEEAIEIIIEIGQASTSFIQRRFKIGYARACKIIDQMEAKGIISGYQGSKPRDVIITRDEWRKKNNK